MKPQLRTAVTGHGEKQNGVTNRPQAKSKRNQQTLSEYKPIVANKWQQDQTPEATTMLNSSIGAR